jgi:hypothetical protein
MSKNKDPTNLSKEKKNGLFWKLLSIFALFLVGFLTSGLYVYEGNLLRRTIKENREQLRKEREKRKQESKPQNNAIEEKMVLSKMKPNILEVLRN